MQENYGRDLDLNLLRVFLAVAECGSVTAAASQLYLTQPAVSAALRRLKDTVGTPLFARQGRGLALTARGHDLLAATRTHLAPLIDAALSPARFNPKTSERTFRLGLSDASETWLLPALLRLCEKEAPRIRLVVLPVQFRTVSDALSSRQVDVAVTVADELPASLRRKDLYSGGFVCLFDPRHVRTKQKKRLTESEYFAHEHVIVSYNGDLRGIVEDLLHKNRRVRCSVSSFDNVGGIVSGSALVATVPAMVARHVRTTFAHLRSADLPFSLPGTAVELLWSAADEDDPASAFLRDAIVRVARANASPAAGPASFGRVPL